MALLNSILLLLACYGLGCIATAYYVVRWRKGLDLRAEGTGTLGARNAGRVLGKGGYVLVSLLDIAKGAAAMGLAKLGGLHGWWLAGAGFAAVLGHIWPVQLRFRGGKGIATGYGVALVSTPLIALAMWLFLIAGRKLLGSWTFAGLFAFGAAAGVVGIIFAQPDFLAGWPLHYDKSEVTLAVALAFLLLWTHRSNLRNELRKGTPDPSPAARRSGPEPTIHS